MVPAEGGCPKDPHSALRAHEHTGNKHDLQCGFLRSAVKLLTQGQGHTPQGDGAGYRVAQSCHGKGSAASPQQCWVMCPLSLPSRMCPIYVGLRQEVGEKHRVRLSNQCLGPNNLNICFNSHCLINITYWPFIYEGKGLEGKPPITRYTQSCSEISIQEELVSDQKPLKLFTITNRWLQHAGHMFTSSGPDQTLPGWQEMELIPVLAFSQPFSPALWQERSKVNFGSLVYNTGPTLLIYLALTLFFQKYRKTNS